MSARLSITFPITQLRLVQAPTAGFPEDLGGVTWRLTFQSEIKDLYAITKKYILSD